MFFAARITCSLGLIVLTLALGIALAPTSDSDYSGATLKLILFSASLFLASISLALLDFLPRLKL